MTTRKLAQFEVSSVGIGCMGFSHGYGALPPEEESIRLMRKAFDMGFTLFDTAEVYAPFVNETLVGKAVKPFRDKIVLTTKFTPCRVGDQDISDIGILASTDILAIDQASVDLVYSSASNKDLVERMESRHGLRQLSAMRELKMGNPRYELIDVTEKA